MRDFWNQPLSDLISALNSDSASGISEVEALRRLQSGNRPGAPSKGKEYLTLLLKQFKSPLVIILIAAVILSSLLREYTNAIIILTIILLSAVTGFWQEARATNATKRLLDLIKVNATVVRGGKTLEVPLDRVVPGDIIVLNAGDVIPGDCRIIESKDLHVNEAPLTGESFPQPKDAGSVPSDAAMNRRTNCLFQGTSVVNGTASAIVVHTGKDTVFGNIASNIGQQGLETSFGRGIRRFGYLLMRSTLILALIVVTLNIYFGKPVIDSFLFGLALALGMTPELLPAIITITLSAGAKQMSEKKVIVKRLESIQDFGSINVLCVDKTGTLTQGTVEVFAAVDVNGAQSERVKRFAYLNAIFETGFSNPIDEAFRNLRMDAGDFSKVDEVPYDFIRKRLSVVASSAGRHLMITKGAVQNILSICSTADVDSQLHPIENHRNSILDNFQTFSAKGFRTIALAYKDVTDDPVINRDDENGMTFLGLIALTDPLKPGITSTVGDLHRAGVAIKLISGDNQLVAAHVSNEIGLEVNEMLTGEALGNMTDEALIQRVKTVQVFAETEPHQKQRIVRALRKAGFVVGYMGDGINDISAMRAADVSISVDSAVDVAKESADIVLLEKDLKILRAGIDEGRKTFVNTMKYVFLTSSANLGNMVSMALASVYLPFLPLLPKQILLTNFLTDLPAMMLPHDKVDADRIEKPVNWNIRSIYKFMLYFGLQSSLFDLITFGVLLGLFHTREPVFQTSWFIESVVTEILVLLVIRTPRPVFSSAPSIALLATSFLVILVTCVIPFLPSQTLFGFEGLPVNVAFAMLAIAGLYSISAEVSKRFFFRRIYA